MGKEGTDNVLEIYMLGGLELYWRGKQIYLGKGLSSKQLRLLLILLYSRADGIRREHLLEQLYMDSDVEQASNSLRAMVFRLRRSLAAAGLPKGEYITNKGGIYRWYSQEVQVVLDVEEFQKKAAAALKEQEPERQTELLEAACKMYRGEFLPTMIADGWVAAANWKYQELYFRCLRRLGYHLKQQQRYQDLLGYCEQAVSTYPYEEWQILKMECLAGMREYGMAMEYYEKVVEESREEFGTEPSEQMTQVYRWIRSQTQYGVRNIEEIRTHMDPGQRERGACHCDYLTFVDIYQYMVWVFERQGTRAQLLLFTIMDRKGIPLETSPLLEQARESLEQAIGDSVRKADLFTCCGRNQFLVLLTGTDDSGCIQAAERIRARFQELNHSRRVELYYTRQMAGGGVRETQRG